MLTQLIEKVNNWSLENADAFHNTTIRDSNMGKYIWQYDNNGVFIWKDFKSHFIRNDGYVFKLSKNFTHNDWKMHTSLYELSLTNNDFRIEIPVEMQLIDLNESTWQYSIVKRPTPYIGRDYFMDIADGLIDNEYITQYIDEAFILLKYLKNLSKEHNSGLPSVRIPLTKRRRDEYGFYWYDFKQWDLPYDHFFKQNIQDLEGLLGYLKFNNLIHDVNIENTIIKAKDKWNILIE
jgi:hypothetical protein